MLERQLAYWRTQLAGAPPLLELPTGPPAAGGRSGRRGASASALAAGRAERRLQALSRGEGATLFMMLLAGFQVLLARYSGQDDVVVGTPDRRTRTRAEMEGLIGFFVNTLVLRTRPVRRPDASGRCCGGCARRRWAPTRTRTCRSRSWWRSCSRSAT